ncbi:MAG: conjugal transfer protein TraG N-terminal domain-containing protein [Candidatus Berkiella sp.]
MDVSIYCCGSGELVKRFLEAVAMLVKPNSGYYSCLAFAFLLATAVAAVQYIQTRRLSALVFAVLRYTIISTVLLSPVATVQVIDEVYPGQNLSVSHVPLGLALPASLSSRFFHGLTQLIETAFHMPDDLNYTRNGFLFASSLVQKSIGFKAINSKDRQNLKNYVEQCVFYDIHHGKYSFDDLRQTEDIWQLISAKPSPIRSFLMDSKVATCKEGTLLLEQRWNDIITESGIKYAKAIFPGLKKQSEAQLKTALLGSLEISYQHLTELSKSSTDIMKQLIMFNAIEDGAMNHSSLGALSYSKSRGDMQKFLGSVNTGMLAAQWLPILKDVIECMLYAVFILIVIYALFTDGYKVLINYGISLAYLGSWPVVYAFLNYGATFALRLTSSGYSLNMMDLPYLDTTNYYLSAIFGYVTLSVPYLAWQLINLGKQGLGSALTQLSQLVGGSTQNIAMSTAQEVATGSFSLGNTSFDNHSINTMSGFKHDHNLSYANGMMSASTSGGAVISQFQDGHNTINQTPALSNLNTQIHLANSLRTSAGEQADTAYQAALNDAVSYTQHMDTAFRGMLDYGKSVSLSESSGDTESITKSASTSDSLQHVLQDVSRFAESNNISIDKAYKHLLGAYINGNAHASWGTDKAFWGKAMQKASGLSVGANLTGGGKSEWDVVSSNNDSVLFSKAQEFVQNENFSQNLESSLRSISEGSYRTNTEEGKRLANSISTSFGEAENASNSMSANLQSSESYRNYASYTEDNAATIDRNATQDFVDWLSCQPLQSGMGGMGVQQAEVMLRQNPQLAESYAQQFVKETTTQKLDEWRSNHVKPSSVNTAYQSYQNQVPQKNLQNIHDSWSEAMTSHAQKENVGFGMVNKQKQNESKQILGGLEEQINTGRNNVYATEDRQIAHTEAMMHKHARGTEKEK